MALPRGSFALFSNLVPPTRRQLGGNGPPVTSDCAAVLDTIMEQWLCAALEKYAMLPYNVWENVFRFVPRAFWFVSRAFHATARFNFQQMPIQQKRALLENQKHEACKKIQQWEDIWVENEKQLHQMYRTCNHPQSFLEWFCMWQTI